MKKQLLLSIIIILIYSGCSYSQFEYYKPDMTEITHFKGERSFSIAPNVLTNTPYGVQFAGGLKTRYFVSRRISMDADLVFGRKYMHFGPGLIAVPFLLFQPDAINSDYQFDSFSDLFFFLGFYMLSFEHVAYHIPLKQYTDISPYICLMRFKSAGENEFPANNNAGTGQFTFASGIELNKYFGRFVFSPYVENNIGYKDHISGINMGVYFGYMFPSKN
jgi:hypothetical protein